MESRAGRQGLGTDPRRVSARIFRSKSRASVRCGARAATPTATRISAATSCCGSWPTTRDRNSSTACSTSSRRYKPLHLSIVGGEPLVRFRELEVLLPKLTAHGRAHAGRHERRAADSGELGEHAASFRSCVSIDGLQPEHDVRRAPATYDRILKHIKGQHVTVHCTITRQQSRAGLRHRVHGLLGAAAGRQAHLVQPLHAAEGRAVAGDAAPRGSRSASSTRSPALYATRAEAARHDSVGACAAICTPPQNPDECIFAKTTACLSADLKRAITPCQYGGDPDCTQCGCMASVGLGARRRLQARRA